MNTKWDKMCAIQKSENITLTQYTYNISTILRVYLMSKSILDKKEFAR